MKSRYLSLLIAGLTLTLSACKKQFAEHTTAPPLEADVYVAGFIGAQSQAAYWINGSLITLTQPGSNAFARSIAVNDNGVYVAGSMQGASGLNAILWFNGATTVLSDPSVNADAMSIAVSGSDVYVAGWQYDDALGHQQALYWKNGTATLLNGGVTANSIVVSGSDVYVAGQTLGGVAAYWKNGTMTTLPEGNTANAITVVGPDVYVAGKSAVGSVLYWKNGAVTQLTDGPSNATAAGVTGIAVLGGNVYVAGGMPNGDAGLVPTLWKNTTPQMLPVPSNLSSSPSNNEATGIAVFMADVYTAGEVNNNTTHQYASFYWKNGGTPPVQLQDDGAGATAYGIAVVQRGN